MQIYKQLYNVQRNPNYIFVTIDKVKVCLCSNNLFTTIGKN